MERRPIDETSGVVATLLRDPVWQLVMVSQEGSGPCTECGTSLDDMEEPAHADFAYTVGLHEWFGRPEVHCSGLSNDEDPASLELETLGEIVNTAAARTVARELGPGSEFEVTVTNGHGRYLLRFTLGLPCRPLAVTALMAHPEATVIPIRWAVVETECPCTRREAS
jgi:hypothetical protein